MLMEGIEKFVYMYEHSPYSMCMNDLYDVLNLQHTDNGYRYGFPCYEKSNKKLNIYIGHNGASLIIQYGKGSAPVDLIKLK